MQDGTHAPPRSNKTLPASESIVGHMAFEEMTHAANGQTNVCVCVKRRRPPSSKQSLPRGKILQQPPQKTTIEDTVVDATSLLLSIKETEQAAFTKCHNVFADCILLNSSVLRPGPPAEEPAAGRAGRGGRARRFFAMAAWGVKSW